MNGYSQTVKTWSNEKLLRRYAEVRPEAKYSGPAEDIHWIYKAILEELSDRNIDPSKTITTDTGIMIPCGNDGRPHRDQPERFIKRRW